MKKIIPVLKTQRRAICALAALALIAVLAVRVLAQGVGSPPVNVTLDPQHDGQGITIWAWWQTGPYDYFKTYGDFNFQTPQHGTFIGNGFSLTNIPLTSLAVSTNTALPASTNAPVGWGVVTGTNGVSYKVALYQ